MRRRMVFAGVGALLATPCVPVSAEPGFPDRPLRVIVAFTPGTGSDTLMRAIGPAMSQVLGQPIVIENRSGVGGILGTEFGAQAAADGYTLTLGTTSTLLTAPVLKPTARYRIERDFAPVAALSRTAFVVTTANRVGAPRDMQELLRRLESGKEAFASNGVGTLGHLAAATLLRRLSQTAIHIPYRGSFEAATGVAGEQELFMVDSIGASQPLIRTGRLRALAVTAEKRLDSMPDVPTVVEAGVPFLQLRAWWGLLVPASTPQVRIDRLWGAAAGAMTNSLVRQQLIAQGQEPMLRAPAEFGLMISAETREWEAFVRSSGVS